MGSKIPSRPPSITHQEPIKDNGLAVVDYFPPGKRPKKLIGGAYDPYERPIPTGDTVRVQRPKTDLRQLSAWIKTKKEVDAQREGEPTPPEKSRPR